MSLPSSTRTTLQYLAANVQRIRRKAGLTQEELAEAAGVSTIHMQRIERGEANTRVSTITAIADALQVPVGRLFRKASMLPRKPGRPKSF